MKRLNKFLFLPHIKSELYITSTKINFTITNKTNYLQLLCDANSMLENFGSINIDDVSVGLWTTIWRICVSRPLWWLANTAIWIIHVFIGFERASRVGTITHPAGSWISKDLNSTKLLWLIPVRIEILSGSKTKN
jgi:hypothetical protein